MVLGGARAGHGEPPRLFPEKQAALEIPRTSAPHDMNGEDAALVAGEEVIDEIADDGIGFVA